MAVATREAYGKTLAALIQKYDDIFVLDADLTKSTKTIEAKKAREDHHFNMGIAEANMMSVAAGMASSNKVVYASSFAMFAAGRAYEQIRNSICYPNLNVKICATHAGITVGEDGASHQSIEDISLMRSIPNMKVFQPCDAKSTEQIIKAVYSINGPCYVRLGRLPVENVYDDSYSFEIGKGNMLVESDEKKVCIISTGMMVQECLKARNFMKNVKPSIIDMPTIKPIDISLIKDVAQKYDVIVTIEEHSIIGGLGSAVSEVLSELKNKKSVLKRLGINDVFGRSGSPDKLLDYYGLSAMKIAEYIDEIK